MVYTATMRSRKWINEQIYQRSDLPPTSIPLQPPLPQQPSIDLQTNDNLSDPLWFQGDDIIPMSMLTLRKIFKDFNPVELPRDLARNKAAIETNHADARRWELADEQRRMTNHQTIQVLTTPPAATDPNQLSLTILSTDEASHQTTTQKGSRGQDRTATEEIIERVTHVAQCCSTVLRTDTNAISNDLLQIRPHTSTKATDATNASTSIAATNNVGPWAHLPQPAPDPHLTTQFSQRAEQATPQLSFVQLSLPKTDIAEANQSDLEKDDPYINNIDYSGDEDLCF